VTKDEALHQGWDQEPVEEPVFDREVDPATMGAATTGTREQMSQAPMPPPEQQSTMNDTNPL
jgi:hypothetical protein